MLVFLALVIAPIAPIGTNLSITMAQSQPAQSASGASSSQTSPQTVWVTTTVTGMVYLPVIMANYLPPIIPVTTNVLTATTTNYLSAVSSDNRVFTFTQSTPALATLVPGEIIVSDVSPTAPNGFLRKVKAITSAGQQIVLETESATLEETIQQGEAQISRQLTPRDVQSTILAPGVALEVRSLSGQSTAFYLKMDDVVVYDDDGNLNTINDQVLATGSVEFDPTLNFSLRIRNWKLEDLEFTTKANETVELKFETKLEKSFIQKKNELARYTLSPITVIVGVVPVVIVPILTINVGINGSAHVGVTMKVTQQASLNAGAKYANGNWSPVGKFTHQFTFTPPSLSAGLDIKGYAGPRLSLLLYGVTGPYIEMIAYLKLEADTSQTPWWELYSGLEVPVGVRVEILGRALANVDLLAIGVKVSLAQAQIATAWPMFAHDPSRTSWNNFETVLRPPLSSVWTRSINDYYVDALSVANGMIYLSGMGSDNKNKVYALSISGEPRWSYTLTAGGVGAMDAPPAYYKNVVYFGGQHDNNLYAANNQNGNILWTFSGIKGLYASPLSVLDNVIYAFGEQSKLYAVGTETGKVLWSQDANGWGGKTAIWGDVIVAVAWNTRPSAFNRITGQRLWQRSDITTYFSDIVTYDDIVYLGSKAKIIALDLHDGKTIWSTSLPNNPQLTEVDDYTLAFANEVLYAAGGVRATDRSPQPQNILFALNSKTGNVIWQTGVSSTWITPVIANGVVYAARVQQRFGKGEIVALDINDGTEIWRWQPTGSNYLTAYVIADNYLYLTYYQENGTSTVVAFKNSQ